MRVARWCGPSLLSLFDSQLLLTCLRSPWKVPSTARRRMVCLPRSLAERYATNCSPAVARPRALSSSGVRA